MTQSDEQVARTVRRRAAIVGAVAALALVPALWMDWEGDLEVMLLPAALSAYIVFMLARVALNPLRYRHLVRRSPLQDVLDSGGVPEEAWAGSSTLAERVVVTRDLMDELGDGAEGFLSSGFGRSLGRVIGGVGTAAWLVAAGVAFRYDGWASAAICGAASLIFAVPLALGVRDERRRGRAIALLRGQLDELGHLESGPGPDDPAPRRSGEALSRHL